MCGIIGYLGLKQTPQVLLKGLQCLEYRGYDSAGMATLDQGTLGARHVVGRVDELATRLQQQPFRRFRWQRHCRAYRPGGVSGRRRNSPDQAGRLRYQPFGRGHCGPGD